MVYTSLCALNRLRWPFLTRSGRDTFRLPDDMPSVPLMYSLRAHHTT